MIGDSTGPQFWRISSTEYMKSLSPGVRLDKTGIQVMLWPKQLAQNTVPVARVKNERKKKDNKMMIFVHIFVS